MKFDILLYLSGKVLKGFFVVLGEGGSGWGVRVDMFVDGFGVGLVGFYGDNVEVVVLDKVFCEFGVGLVEFWGVVGGVVD